MRRRSSAPALLAALLGLADPARGFDLAGPAGGHFSLPVQSLKQRQSTGILYQQFDFSCGSAAIALLLTHHYGRSVTEQQVFQAMFEQGDREKIQREGFSLADMQRYLQALGYQADGFREPLAKLEASGLPAITLIRDNGYNHFVVIKGIRDGRILLGDPAMGLRAMPIPQFESIWPNKVLFVIHSHQQLARTNLPAEWAARPRAPLGDPLARDSLVSPMLRKQAGDLF